MTGNRNAFSSTGLCRERSAMTTALGRKGTVFACRTALAAFALFFLVGAARGQGVAACCGRGVLVALAAGAAAKAVFHVFLSALVDELGNYVHKERKTRKSEAES